MTITLANKIIVVHRRFIWLSFIDPTFAFTRVTCVAAAKTILNEFKLIQDEDTPNLWHNENFSVVAAIILSLDIFNRDQKSEEYLEHRQVIRQTIDLLLNRRNVSSISSRGARLLQQLLLDEEKVRSTPQESSSRKRSRDGSLISSNTNTKSGAFDVSAFVKRFCKSETLAAATQLSDLKPLAEFRPTRHGDSLELGQEEQLVGDAFCNVPGQISSSFNYDLFSEIDYSFPPEELEGLYIDTATEQFQTQEMRCFDSLLEFTSLPNV
ncbi:hypothetical protein BP5796_12643 [Coleophoma crateriformis]|uniref:Transcription factor domain-containing protein n=1 Tax=Coleophoma crateriformis TaxID=565419 RepID=A0A3D8Q5V4_9HELO|nr:hypothetical protein BP5796_12643 [Coleophoma crateriformis]